MRQRNAILLVVIIVGGISLFAAAFVLALQDNANPLTAASRTDDPEVGGGRLPDPVVPRLSLADARSAFDSGSAVFLDVRNAESYAASHIPGALNIPLEQLPQRLAELDPADWIITYCT